MGHARQVDANQTAVVAAFRAAGASVLHLHTVGEGCPDLLVGIGQVDCLVEVKDGRKPPSARQLNEEQLKFRSAWRGRRVEVVYSAGDAFELALSLKREAVSR
jgi:hypothetical protein